MKKNKNKDALEEVNFLDMMAFGGMLNPATVFDVSSDLLATTTGNAVTQMVRSLRQGEREQRMGTENTGAIMANGGVSGTAPVEVEGGEMMETPDGQVAEIEGPTHENGGVKTELPVGTKVYSDRLKVNGETMSDRKKNREKRIEKIAKLLEKAPKDKLLQESFDRTKTLNEAEEMKDMQYQEMTNQFFEDTESLGLIPEMKHGGYLNVATGDSYASSALKMANGGYLKDKNTYVTKDGKETKRGLWANVYMKKKREGKLAYGGKVHAYGGKIYANGTPPEGVFPTSFKTNADVNKLITGLYGNADANNVKKLQQAIVDSGYDLKGGADGVVGPATRGYFNTPGSSNLLTQLLTPSGTMTGDPNVPTGMDLGITDPGITGLGDLAIEESLLPNYVREFPTGQLPTIYPLDTEGNTTMLEGDQRVVGFDQDMNMPLVSTKEGIVNEGLNEFAGLAKDLTNIDPSYFNLPNNFADLPLEQQTIALQQLGIVTPDEGGEVKQSNNLLDKAQDLLDDIGLGGDGTTSESGGLDLTRGDLMGLAGNIQGKYGPLAATLLNRMETPANVNMFREFGADALRAQEEAIGLATTNRDKLLQDVQLRENAMRARGRNTARSVNTMRALDIAADMQAGQGEQGAYNMYANQMMQLLGQKASLENQQDRVVMQGEQARDLADRQDIDNFYTNLAQNLANMSEFTQKTGRDLNKAIYNQDFLEAASRMSQYGIGYERGKDGKLKMVYKNNQKKEK